MKHMMDHKYEPASLMNSARKAMRIKPHSVGKVKVERTPQLASEQVRTDKGILHSKCY